MLKLQNRIMDSIRKFGLHPPHEETRVDDKGLVDIFSFRNYSDGYIGKRGRRSTLVPGLPTLSILTTTDRYLVGVCHQIWEKCGSLGVQEVQTGTARVTVILILMKLLEEKRWGHILDVSTHILGARRCPVYAHGSRKMEESRDVRDLSRTPLIPHEEKCRHVCIMVVLQPRCIKVLCLTVLNSGPKRAMGNAA